MNEVYDKDMSRFDEMLSRYIKGRLSDAEEVEFNRLIVENEELRNKAIATARLVKAMNEVGSEQDNDTIEAIKQSSKEDIKRTATSISGTTIKNPRILTFRKFVVSFSAAASILLCIFGGYKYYKYEQVTSLGSEYLAYFPASEFSRGENDGVSDILKELYSDIETKHNLGDAIARLCGQNPVATRLTITRNTCRKSDGCLPMLICAITTSQKPWKCLVFSLQSRLRERRWATRLVN